ncbi:MULTISPECIES: hypothetical protein [unclassified Streptomyces]|uniref:hypothetical protein n=1 Tax=unclassified Streptomyces TaxID=2593676 RepID=UPI002E29AAB5|nr:hypothetical protein [Streptomyces sp. NBC_00223]
MKWDDITLVILAAFGCITLLLTQISEVLSRLPQIIRAWRQVRQELRSGIGSGPLNRSASATDPATLPAGSSSGGSHASGEPEAGSSAGSGR